MSSEWWAWEKESSRRTRRECGAAQDSLDYRVGVGVTYGQPFVVLRVKVKVSGGERVSEESFWKSIKLALDNSVWLDNLLDTTVSIHSSYSALQESLWSLDSISLGNSTRSNRLDSFSLLSRTCLLMIEWYMYRSWTHQEWTQLLQQLSKEWCNRNR